MLQWMRMKGAVAMTKIIFHGLIFSVIPVERMGWRRKM